MQEEQEKSDQHTSPSAKRNDGVGELDLGHIRRMSANARVEGSVVELMKEFFHRFLEDNIFTLAAALAFTAILSLLPILLFAILALGFVFRDPAVATQHMQQFVAQLLPGESASRAANDLLEQTQIVRTAQEMSRNVGWPLVMGILSLLWTGISLFVTASATMNAAWDVKETRSFFRLRLVTLGVMLGAGAICLVSLLFTGLPTFSERGALGTLVPPLVWMIRLGSPLVALLLDASMFILIYKVLPDVRVSWHSALLSGVVTAVLWEAFKQGFAFYLVHFGSTGNKLYGALAGVVLLVTWIYYSCIVLLSGAEIGKMYHEHREEGAVARRPDLVC